MSKILFVVPPYTCWGVQIIGTWPPLQLAYPGTSAEKASHYDAVVDRRIARGILGTILGSKK